MVQLADLLLDSLERDTVGLASRPVVRVSAAREHRNAGAAWRPTITPRALLEFLLTHRDLAIHGFVVATASVVGVVSVPRVDPADLGVLGLASELSWVTYLALAALIIGFCVAVVRSRSQVLLAAYVGATTVAVHGLGSLAYEHLRYPWAWKHVGIVDYIQRTGGVDPAIDNLNAYHSWPGFFGLNSLLTDTAGLENALGYAAWAPVFMNLLYLAALFIVFRTFTLDGRIIWTGLLVFTLGNWIGQDYFAPQAIAFFFYLIVIALLLHWFPLDREPHAHEQRDAEPMIAAGLLLAVLAATVVTHQLTPVMILVAVTGLTLFRRTTLRWPAFATGALMAAWLLSFARPFFDEYAPKVIADLGRLGGRVESGLIDLGQVDTSQQLVSLAARGATVLVLLLGALGFVRGFRDRINWKVVLILGASPLILVAASSYGDEIIFRAFLFILPVASVLAGAVWFGQETKGGTAKTIIRMSTILLTLAFLSLVAMHGNDVYTTFTDDEVAAASMMYEVAPSGSGLIHLSTSYPANFYRYENLTPLTLSTFSAEAKQRFLSDPAVVAAEWLSLDGLTHGFVLLTRGQAADVTRRGYLPEGSSDDIENSLRQSSDFDILYDSDDGVLFELRRS